jgi:hypothetical protein
MLPPSAVSGYVDVGGCSLSTYLVPLAHSVSSTFLEQLLVMRNTVFAVDEAVAEGLLAIASTGEMRPFRDPPPSTVRCGPVHHGLEGKRGGV